MAFGARVRLGALVTLVLVSFGMNHVVTRYLVSNQLLDPLSTTFVRFGAGTVALVTLLFLGEKQAAKFSRHDVATALLLSAYAVAMAIGYRHIGAAAGTFVSNAAVVATMTLGAFFLERDAPTRRAVAGSVLALGGIAVLAWGKTADVTTAGVVLLSMTGAAWGAYTMALRRRGDPVGTNARAFAATTILAPLALAPGAFPGQLSITWQGVVLALVMGIGFTALAYAGWGFALRHLSRAQSAVYQLAAPIVGGAAGVLLLNEAWSARLAWAGVLVLAGMALATPPRARPRPRIAAGGSDMSAGRVSGVDGPP